MAMETWRKESNSQLKQEASVVGRNSAVRVRNTMKSAMMPFEEPQSLSLNTHANLDTPWTPTVTRQQRRHGTTTKENGKQKHADHLTEFKASSERLYTNNKKKRGQKQAKLESFTSTLGGIDDIYYKNTCFWDPEKVKTKLKSLEGTLDPASRKRVQSAMEEDARVHGLWPKVAGVAADTGSSSASTKSDLKNQNGTVSRKLGGASTTASVVISQIEIDKLLLEAQRQEVAGILGTQRVDGVSIPFGVDNWGDVLGFRHPSLGPPMGHYWNKDKHVDGQICESENPRNFYIQNYETKRDLEVLVTAMKVWYDTFWTIAPLICRSEVLLGGFYAVYVAKYDHWYRCTVDQVIIGHGRKFDVVVNLIDYGSVELVGHDSIFYLRDIYCTLPRQAARGMIHGVEGDFSPEVINEFKKDVDMKVFQLYIVNRNCEPTLLYPTLSVLLIQFDEEKIERIYDMAGQLDVKMLPEALDRSTDDEAEDKWSENVNI